MTGRRLPITTIAGRQYYIDRRLKEYRAVNNPHDRITFDDYNDRLNHSHEEGA